MSLGWLLRRLGAILLVLLVVSFAVFAITQLLPGNVAYAILGQFATLWRSLQLEDDESAHYRMTLRWFLASIILLLIALGLSALSYSRLIRF